MSQDLPTFAADVSFFEAPASTRDSRATTAEAEEDEVGTSWRGGKSIVGAHASPRVAYYFPKGVGEYHFGERHPMKPHRLTLTNHLVGGYDLFKYMGVYQPRDASKTELEAFHDSDYIEFLERAMPNHKQELAKAMSDSDSSNNAIRYGLGDDCPIFSGLFDFCKQYTGGTLMAARKLNLGAADITVNWSGGLHHAKKSEASGFCYVNDIVLGILELLRVHARVLYIDIDIHHGDGVQEAFYQSNRVLTVSFHKYSPVDFFPGTGAVDETGYGIGSNFSLNVPLQDGIDNESYVTLFKAIMEPTINTFRPSVIVLQCGADSLGCDRLGAFNLSIAAHGECVRYIKSFNLPLMVLGGGGYTLRNVARCWAYETSVLLSDHCPPISNTLPVTAYHSFFAPDYKLHPNITARVDNLNEGPVLERLRIKILERLRYLHGAPSVQMSEIPPDLATWLAEEEDEVKSDRGERGHEGSGAAATGHLSAEGYFSQAIADSVSAGMRSMSTAGTLTVGSHVTASGRKVGGTTGQCTSTHKEGGKSGVGHAGGGASTTASHGGAHTATGGHGKRSKTSAGTTEGTGKKRGRKSTNANAHASTSGQSMTIPTPLMTPVTTPTMSMMMTPMTERQIIKSTALASVMQHTPSVGNVSGAGGSSSRRVGGDTHLQHVQHPQQSQPPDFRWRRDPIQQHQSNPTTSSSTIDQHSIIHRHVPPPPSQQQQQQQQQSQNHHLHDHVQRLQQQQQQLQLQQHQQKQQQTWNTR